LLRVPRLPASLSLVALLLLVLLLLLPLLLCLLGGATIFPRRVALGLPPRRLLLLLGPRLRSLWCLVLRHRAHAQNMLLTPLLLLCVVCCPHFLRRQLLGATIRLHLRCNLARLLRCPWTRRHRTLRWCLLLLLRMSCLRAPLSLCLLGVRPLLAPCCLLLQLLLLLL
jgi:hypothetical protein